jgi:hypothetical protein
VHIDGALDWVTTQLKAGATPDILWNATLLAGVYDIEPDPVGFDFHCVLVVSPAYELAQRAAEAERLIPLFWNVDDFKHSQNGDRRGGDWVLPPPPAHERESAEAARVEFVRAMEEWDVEAADRAVSALHMHLGVDELFELLWDYGARSFADIGHNAIYVAHAYRAVPRLEWHNAQPVLRSVVRGLLSDSNDPSTRAFPDNRAAVQRLKPRSSVPGDTDASIRVLEMLRTADIEDASAAIVAHLEHGESERRLWDGLRLFACEQLLRNPGLLAVHPLTSLNGLRFGARTTHRVETRRLMLVQCATWQVLFRDFLSGRGDESATGLCIETLEAARDKVAPADVLSAAVDNRIDAARGVLQLAKDSAQVAHYFDLMRRQVFHCGYDSHQYKFAAAVSEEFGLSDPRWAPYVLASSAAYVPHARAAETPIDAAIQEQIRILSN